jgi:hypothetical protein
MDKILSLLGQYHLAVMIAALILLSLLSMKKKNSKLLVTCILLLAGSILYEVVQEEPVTAIPYRINRALNEQPVPEKSTNPHYYQIPEEEKKLLDSL